MTLAKTLSTLSFLGLVAMSSAFAADGAAAPKGAVAEACQKDVQTLCPDAKPGDGRIKACLKENRAKLSDACKSAIKARRGEHKAAK